MRINRIAVHLRALVLLGACFCAQGGMRYGPVLPPPSLQFSSVLLKSPPPFGIINSPLPNYEIKVKEFPKSSEKDEAPHKDDDDDDNEEFDEPSSESTSNFGHSYRHHHKKHHHVVLHKHVHKGHVIHDHKHEGEAKHQHKHVGHEKHEHHHHGEGSHEHKHLGKAQHEHKHEGKAEHGHKHKGEGEHKHEHLGAGKHLHKHAGHSEHGHKHEGKAQHEHKHKGDFEHGHLHKGSGKHEHKHWGDADHKHKHEGEGKHKHSHHGHASFSHEHEGHANHKHSHHGSGHHDHKHHGKAHHSHDHKGHHEAKHKHQGKGYLTFYDEHSPSFDDDFKTDLIDVTPKKKKTHKITKEVSYIDPAEFDDFIASLKGSSIKEVKPVYFDEEFEEPPKKKNKNKKPTVHSYDVFENVKADDFVPKYKEASEPFSDEYLKFLNKYVPLKSYQPETFKHGYSGYKAKLNRYEVNENVHDTPSLSSSDKSEHEIEAPSDEEDNDPSLIQYNVVHGKESDVFPSMSYVSTVRNAR